LNRHPKQKLGASQVIEAGIRATVLVNKGILVAESQNGGHGPLILVCDADLEIVPEAINQIAKPSLGLWRNPVPAARDEKQMPEGIE
jgi:hypothetical protein